MRRSARAWQNMSLYRPQRAGAHRRLHQRSRGACNAGAGAVSAGVSGRGHARCKRHGAGPSAQAEVPRPDAGVCFGLSGICAGRLHGERLPLPAQAGHCAHPAQVSGRPACRPDRPAQDSDGAPQPHRNGNSAGSDLLPAGPSAPTTARSPTCRPCSTRTAFCR